MLKLKVFISPSINIISLIDKSTGSVYIMLEDRLDALFKTADEYNVLERMNGSVLEGMKYKPLFPYFKYMKSAIANEGAFRILW